MDATAQARRIRAALITLHEERGQKKDGRPGRLVDLLTARNRRSLFNMTEAKRRLDAGLRQCLVENDGKARINSPCRSLGIGCQPPTALIEKGHS